MISISLIGHNFYLIKFGLDWNCLFLNICKYIDYLYHLKKNQMIIVFHRV